MWGVGMYHNINMSPTGIFFIFQSYRANGARINMALLNLWSLGHFVQWTFVGRFIPMGWGLFFALSIGWEILEWFLPYEFTTEVINNKISDVVVNCAGFYLGTSFKRSRDV